MARAFKREYDYYRLKKDCLGLKAGAIFYYDKDDSKLGSIGAGCLKLAWDADGMCFGYCGDTYVLHASAREDSDFLELVDTSEKSDVIKIIIDRVEEWLEMAESLEDHISDYSHGLQSAYHTVLDYLKQIE